MPILAAVVGDCATVSRRAAVLRGAARWLLPAAGAAIGVLLSAQAAHADAVLSVVFTTPGSVTTATPLTWDVTAADSSPTSCELSRAGTVVAPLADCPGSFTYDPATTGAGVYTLTVYDDTADNVANGATPETATNIVSVAPTTPTPSGPSGPATDRTPTFALGLPAGASGACTVTDSSNHLVNQADPCPDPFMASLPASTDTYTLTVTATAGGVTSAPAQLSYVLDLTAPTVSVTPAGATSNDPKPTFTVSAPGAVSYTCSTDAPAPAQVTPCGASTTLDLSGVVDGIYHLTVSATDAAGNTSGDTTIAYTLDTAAPGAPSVTPAGAVSNNAKPTFTVSDPDAASYTCTIDAPAPAVLTQCGTSTKIDFTGVVDGTYHLTVSATDAAGNTSADTTVAYTLDTVAGTPVVVPPASPTKVVAPVVDISDPESGVTFTCVLTGPGGGAPLFTGACPANGIFDTSAGTDGTYTLVVTAHDGAGNTSNATVTWDRDTAAPPAPIVSAPPALTNSNTVTLTISDGDATAHLSCQLTDPDGNPVGNATCPSGGSFDTSGHPDGTYTLTVTATDPAGNKSQTTTVAWVLDTTPPPAPSATGAPGLTKSTSVTLSISDAQSDATLTCQLVGPGGGTVSSGACPANGKFDTTGHGDGLYTLAVTATDPAGNTSTTTVSWTRDTTPPAQPNVQTPSSPSNDQSPSFTVTDSDTVASWQCDVSGPSSASATTCGPTTTLNLTGVADGTYTVSVIAIDAAGNSSLAGTATYELDTTPPPAPSVSAPPALTKSRSVTVTINDAETGVTLTCEVTDPLGHVVSSTTCPANGTFATPAGHPDGTYTLVVTAADAAGNTSSTTVTWVLDTTPPPAPTVSTPAGLTKSTSVTLTISDSESGVTFTCSFTGPGGAVLSSGACPAGGVFDTGSGADGVYTVTVTATDPAGNTSSTTVSWTQDTTPPAQPNVRAPVSPSNDRSPSFAVTDADTVTSWQCDVTGPSTVTVSSCGPTTTVNLTGAADGTYTVSVIAIDAAGNPSSAGTATYELDTTPPPAPTVSAPPALTNSPSVTITSSDAESGVTLTCRLTDPQGHVVNASACPANGAYNASGHPDGTYTLVVTAADAAGNTSSTTVTWVLDTTPPPAPSVSAPPTLTNSMSVTLTISDAQSDATLTCALVGPGGGTVSTGPCPAGGAFDTTGHGDGVYTLTVTATDPAGNSSTTTVSWTRDTTPPAQPSVQAPTSPARSRAPSFTVTDADTVATWQCSVTGPSTVTVSSCGPTTTLNLTGGADGTYTVSVTAVDAAGNPSTAGTATYELDTTPPPAPTVSAPPALTKSPTVTLTISDSEADATVTCVLTAPGGATVLSGLCPATFDTTGYGDGTYTLVVTATDPSGNASTATVSWVRDTIPPPTPTVTAPTSPSKVTSPSFTVADTESGVTYTCSVTGPGSATASCGATTTLNLSGDGTYTLTVTATDAAGNVSPAGSATYLLDTTAPTAPVVTTGASPAQGRHISFSISGIENAGILTCTLSGPTGASVSVPQSCSSSVPLDLSGQPDGAYTLSVTVTDAAGNISNVGAATYTLDTTPPLPPGVSAPASPGNDRTPTFGISGETGATLTCTVARYFQEVSSGVCAADGTIDLSGYDDGDFQITVVATDAAGNVSGETTVSYTLDTTPPDAPVLTEPASPSPIEKPMWLFTLEDGTLATCTITGPTGAIVQGPVACSSPFTGLLKGLPDGKYTLTVVISDAAGNQSTPVRSVFTLDRQAPVPPTVVPPSSPGNSRQPAWQITTPKGATLTCTLMRGGVVVSAPGACPTGGLYSLAGLPDGTYTLRVTAIDSAGNISATSVSTYVLDTVTPSTPRLEYSTPSPSLSVKPYWGFTLPAGTTGRCELLHNGTVIASKSDCRGAVSFDLTGRAVGTYTIRVYATDAAGNVSRPMTASYVFGGSLSGGGTPGGVGGDDGGFTPPPPTAAHHHRPSSKPSSPSGSVQQILADVGAVAAGVGSVGKHVVSTAKHVASAILPDFHDNVTEHVSKAVQGVVNAVTHAGGGTGFPLLLLFVVLVFLLVQNRIDRKDPKLALASVAADDTIEFRPPPSRESRA